MIRTLLSVFVLSVFVSPLAAVELKPETVRAWDLYFKWADDEVRKELSDAGRFFLQNYLSSGEQAEITKKLESGEIVVRQREGVIPPNTSFDVPDGEIHHWWGAVLLPDVTVSRLLDFFQDYNNHAGKFADVERSRILSKEGNHYRVYFRFRRTKIITAVYNTEQHCHYTMYSPGKGSSQSVATRIAEVEAPGTDSERENPPGNDSGYLWRLVSWWRFEQKGRNVLVELESASLSRDIPAIVRFIPGVSGYIRSTPKESLHSVLESIKKHVR